MRKKHCIIIISVIVLLLHPAVISPIRSIGITMSVTDSSGSEIIHSGTAGENINWTLDNSGTLIFSGTGYMKNYDPEHEMPPWLEKTDDIQSLVIGNGIESVGDYSFFKCEYLENVSLPESVLTIGEHSFHGCTAVDEFYIPSGVKIICDSAFDGCISIEKLTLSEGVQVIGNSAFHSCSSIKDITIPGSTETVGNGAFRGCDLESMCIRKGLRSIGSGAFHPCKNLCNIYYSGDEDDWNNISIGYANFYIIDVCIHYNSLGNAVTWQHNGDTLYFSGDGEMPGYRSDTQPPWSESGFSTAVIGNGIISIGRYNFYECKSLKKIMIPQTVQKIDRAAFFGCTELCDIYFSGSEKDWERILTEDANDDLKNAFIHYNSEIPSDIITGDLNGSGGIDTGDASMILRALVGIVHLTDTQKLISDVNGDGMINTGDATMVLRIVVGSEQQP